MKRRRRTENSFFVETYELPVMRYFFIAIAIAAAMVVAIVLVIS